MGLFHQDCLFCLQEQDDALDRLDGGAACGVRETVAFGEGMRSVADVSRVGGDDRGILAMVRAGAISAFAASSAACPTKP